MVDDRADFATKERFPSADEVLCIPFGTVPAQITIDRTTYLVLVTRAHEHDEAVLRQVADSRAPYIGMIGSKRRVITVYRRLLEEGVTQEQLRRIYAPVGLAISARTPQEIAVAVMAEIVCVKRHGEGNHSALRELPRSTAVGCSRTAAPRISAGILAVCPRGGCTILREVILYGCNRLLRVRCAYHGGLVRRGAADINDMWRVS